MLRNKNIFTISTILLTCLSVFIFPFATNNPLTFAKMNQDKEASLAKYSDIWDNSTITYSSITPIEYIQGEIVATITIPKMDIYELPVYYGSNPVNNNWQITTSGHLGNYAMFGELGVSSIGAHNYQLFKNLVDLEIGDKLIVETHIDTYVYVVEDFDIYDHTKDIWNQKAMAHDNGYTLTLMTCFPIDAIETNDMYIVYTSLQKGTIFDSH